MATESRNAFPEVPDQLHPELVTDDFLSFFARYDGDTLPNDLCELAEFTEKLTALKEAVHRILEPWEKTLLFCAISRNLIRKEERCGKSRYDLTAEELSLNDTLFILLLPFCVRMDGSWEVRFALSGLLIRYLKIYREKLDAR